MGTHWEKNAISLQVTRVEVVHVQMTISYHHLGIQQIEQIRMGNLYLQALLPIQCSLGEGEGSRDVSGV